MLLLNKWILKCVDIPTYLTDTKQIWVTQVKVLRAAPDFPKVALFSTVVLNEPPKEVVMNFKPGMPVHREAFAVVFDRVNNKTYE